MNKFKVGDKVKIMSDKYFDYGLLLNKIGEIAFCGSLRRGVRTYHVKFGETCVRDITVYEPDMELNNGC